MTRVTRSATRPATRRVTSDPTTPRLTPSTVRATISGKRILDHHGVELTALRGANYFTWNTNIATSAAAAKADGQTCVRLGLRWRGLYGGATTDAHDLEAFVLCSKANMNQALSEIRSFAAQGIWMVIPIDSNCGQSGIQTGFGGEDSLYCDPGQLYANGNNFFTNYSFRGEFKELWKEFVRELMSIDYVLALEILPEPLQGFNNTWTANLIGFYREMIAAIRTVDPVTPFLIGARQAYKPSLVAEVYMAERTDVIYTCDLLDDKTTDVAGLPANVAFLVALRDANNVPVLVQQLGVKTSSDATGAIQHGALALVNAYGVPWIYWTAYQNTLDAGGYSLWLSDGAGGYTAKNPAHAVFVQHLADTFAALETAAVAAATAAGATLFYVKSDLSNVKQDSAGTTPVTAVGQPIGLVNPVVGAITLSQATAGLRPLLSAGVNGYTMTFDGVDDVLQGSAAYYASGDDMTVIASGTPAATAVIQIAVHVGNSTTNARHPYLGCLATKLPTVSWRGDDTTLREVDGTTSTAARPLVLAATRASATKTLYVNGSSEGTPDANAVGAIATVNRLRVGANTVGSSNWAGPIGLVCLCKGGMTSAQRIAIGRFAAYLVGAAYQA